MSQTLVAKRVAKGVAWLDKEIPDWPQRVVVNKLALDCTDNCVLGQLFKKVAATSPQRNKYGDLFTDGFSYVVEKVFPRKGWARTHGFDAYSSGNDFALLQVEWERVIKERRRASS